MVILVVYIFALNAGLGSLLHINNLMLLCILLLIPFLMLGLPMLVFCYIDHRRNQLAVKLIQQLLRASAGSDELLVRELQEMTCNRANPAQEPPKE